MINSYKHFSQEILMDLPVEATPHPKRISICGWSRSIMYSFIFVPVTDLEANPPKINSAYFFCSRCSIWYSMNGTIGNMHNHIKHKHYELVPNEVVLSREERNRNFRYFILTRGLPFSILDDPIIATLFPGIGTRKDLASSCSSIADVIRGVLRSRIVHAQKISLSIDEWKDANSARFLGVQAYCEFPTTYEIYTLGLIHITSKSATARVLADITQNCVRDQYQVEEDQLVGIVTDTANVMKATSDCLGLEWYPCYCHVANIILQTFIQACEKPFNEVQEMQRQLGRNSAFRDFCRSKGSRIISIPSFTETRWYSAYSMFKAISILHPLINQFLEEERKPIPQEIFWDNVEIMLSVLSGFREVILNLERNDFGSRSIVIQSFRYLKDVVHQLDICPDWKPAVDAFDQAMQLKWEFYFNMHRTELLLALRLNPSLHGSSLRNDEIVEIDRYIRSKVDHLLSRIERRRTATNNFRMDFSSWQAMNTPGSQENQDEFTNYLNKMTTEPYDSRGYDLWHFWKKNKDRLPTLYNLAMNVFSIPASSASAEREFKKAKKVQNEHRINLSGSRLEDQLIIVGNERLTEELFNSHRI